MRDYIKNKSDNLTYIRLKLSISYDGTCYNGWQIQEKANPPPTIQGAIEKAFLVITGEKTRVTGSGRTDAGVHAFGQVAHVDVVENQKNIQRDWRHCLNAVLPCDIRILKAERADINFHAQKSAFKKTYIYRFWQETAFFPPHLRNYVWTCGQLDLTRMRSAIPFFIGEHDFASFQNAGTNVVSTIREILSLNIDQLEPLEFMPSYLPQLQLSITANGFLKQMVRNIAGFLVYVGKGKLEPQILKTILACRDRKKLPSPTAPACGLTLAEVIYEKS